MHAGSLSNGSVCSSMIMDAWPQVYGGCTDVHMCMQGQVDAIAGPKAGLTSNTRMRSASITVLSLCATIMVVRCCLVLAMEVCRSAPLLCRVQV